MGAAFLVCVFAIFAGGAYLRERRVRKALAASDSSEQCSACGSADVEVIASNVYRCRRCGYEGGPGLAHMKEQAFAERVAQLLPDQRFMRGKKELEDAKRCLMAAVGTFESIRDNVSLSSLRSLDNNEAEAATELSRGHSEFMEGQQHLRRCAIYLGDSVLKQLGEMSGDMDFGASIDPGWGLSDGSIHETTRDAQRRLEAVERALEGLRPPSGYRDPRAS